MKKNTKRLLILVKGLLDISWYLNFAFIAFVFVFFGREFITKKYTDYSVAVKIKTTVLTDPISPLSDKVQNIILGTRDAVLSMQLKSMVSTVILSLLLFAIVEVLICIILYNLRKVFRTFKENAPFNSENIPRLKTTALCIILFSPVRFIICFLQSMLLADNVSGYNTKFGLKWSFGLNALLIGVVVYIMAEIFSYGFTLQKENREFI